MKIKEIFTNSEGIFSTFKTLFPELYEQYYGEIETSDLDFQVYYNYGERHAAPILSNASTNYSPVIHLIILMHKDQWNRAYEALSTEYSLLQPYSYTEEKSGTDTYKTDETNTTTNMNMAYNSADFEDNTKTINTKTGTPSTTYGSKITKAGNTGNHTNEELVSQELELAKSNFYDIVMKDFIHDLTLSIY